MFFFRPEMLVDEEVVVVTINYRLSALGWLVLKEDGVEGNQVG